jgi:hypothetical protein
MSNEHHTPTLSLGLVSHCTGTRRPPSSSSCSFSGIPNPRKSGSVIGADRQRSCPSCVLLQRVPQGRTESGGIAEGLGQDFQEQKRSSAALVPLEIPRKPWPCAFLMLPALLGSAGVDSPPLYAGPRVPSGGVTHKRRCTYRP